MLAHAILTADGMHGVLQLWAEDSATVAHDLGARRHADEEMYRGKTEKNRAGTKFRGPDTHRLRRRSGPDHGRRSHRP